MTDNTCQTVKLPEPRRIMFDEVPGMCVVYHDPTDFEDWFNRCIDDRPKLSDAAEVGEVFHYTADWEKWFKKRFTQFYDSSRIR